MTFGSLFAGIGGMDLGLERAGMVCKWQVEIDPFCQKILTKHWPEVPKYGDIKKLDGRELERVDLICGGFPCQDVSLAGARRGIGDGTRSGLYVEMLRLVNLLRPRFVLMENVPGLLVPTSPGESAAIGRVLGDLAESGYDAQWQSLPASTFGAYHERDRVFIVAYSDGHHDFMPKREANFGEIRFYLTKWDSWDKHMAGSDGFQKVDTYTEILRDFHGIPSGMDRLRRLGNAIVPQVAEWIGRRIMERCS